MIDPVASWYPIEQFGPALETWTSVWEDTPCLAADIPDDDILSGDKESGNCAQANGHAKSRLGMSLRDEMLNNRQMVNFHPVRRSRTLGPNIASTYGYNSYEKTLMIHSERLCYPWIEYGCKYEQSLAGLDLEIEHFFKYIKPSDCERSSRMILFQSLQNLIKSNFPNTTVDTYGSFKTELFLPTSDIDIVVFSDWVKPPLGAFKKVLIKSGICIRDSILILDKALVPIIKFRSFPYDLRVDITFNTSDAAKASHYIKVAVAKQAPIKPLVMTVKQFLLQRDANEVYHGGISSYALIMMVIAFLKNISNNEKAIKNPSLGELLILFFDFYGRKFDYLNDAISLNSNTGIVKKSSLTYFHPEGNNLSLNLCIIDPLNDLNDIGKSSFGVLKIKSYFESAYWTLMRAINPENQKIYHNAVTVLGRIILITPEVSQYREFIKVSYFQRQIYHQNNIVIMSAPVPPPKQQQSNQNSEKTPTFHPMIKN